MGAGRGVRVAASGASYTRLNYISAGSTGQGSGRSFPNTKHPMMSSIEAAECLACLAHDRPALAI